MGCCIQRTIEEKKKENGGFPLCILTIPLETEIWALAPLNNEKLLMGAKDELKIFDGKSKSIIPTSKKHDGRINCLIKLSNGYVASGSQDTTIKIWDLEKKEVISTLKGHTSIIWDIRELPDNRLISASDDKTSKLWDLKTQKNEVLYKSTRHVSSIAVLKNNKVVLASGNNIFLYDLKINEQISFLDIKVWSLKELSNGDVAAGLGNGLLFIIEVTDELLIKTKFPRGHKKTINNIIELDNHKIVTSSDENDLILWDPNEPESMYLLKGHTNFVTGLCFISGTRFASVSRDKTLKIWE